jgi:hypothetical protein
MAPGARFERARTIVRPELQRLVGWTAPASRQNGAKLEPRIGFEPMSSRLKGEHPGPLDERGGVERTARLELALSAWKADAQPICQARELAESAGVEPARPEGLVALAPRCLAARPTLRIWWSQKDSNPRPPD